MHKILALNGGGAMGLIPAVIIANLEKELGKPSHEIFDLIAGVSTGAILGACLAKGMTGVEVVELYKEFIPTIFGKPRWLVRRIFNSKYDGDILEELLKKNLNVPFNTMKTKLMVHAVKITSDVIEPIFWKSWREDETDLAYKVVKASASAPTFFDSTEIDGDYYIDGSIATNNSSMCALAEHVRINGLLSDVYLTNIACHKATGLKDPNKINGLFKWASKISSAFLSVSDPLAEYQCHQLIGFKNHTIDPDFNAAIDTQAIDDMIMVANRTWELHKKALIENLGE